VKSAVDVSSSALYRLTIRIRSDDTIRSNTNTVNTLFGPLFGTEANTKQIFGTSLIIKKNINSLNSPLLYDTETVSLYVSAARVCRDHSRLAQAQGCRSAM